MYHLSIKYFDESKNDGFMLDKGSFLTSHCVVGHASFTFIYLITTYNVQASVSFEMRFVSACM